MKLELNEQRVRDVVALLRNGVVGGGANTPAPFRAALMEQQAESLEQTYGLAQGWRAALATCSAQGPDAALLLMLIEELGDLVKLIEQRRKMFIDLDAESNGA